MRKEKPVSSTLTKNPVLQLGLLGLAMLATGCATTPPAQEMSDARQSLEAAQTIGASEHAPEVLGNARQLLSQAESDMQNGDYERAQRDAIAAHEAAREAVAIAQAKQQGIKPAAEPEPRPEPAPEQVLELIPEPAMASHYVVNARDNLWGIAAKPGVYGDARLWPLLLKANASLIKSPDMIKPGITLRIERAPSAAEIEAALEYSRKRGSAPLKASDSSYLRQYGLR